MDSANVPVLRNATYGSLLDDVSRSNLLELTPLVPGPLHGPDSPLGQKTFALVVAFAHAVAAHHPELLSSNYLAIGVYAKPDSDMLQAPWHFLRTLWGRDINLALTLMTDGPVPVRGYDPTLFTAVVGDHHLPHWVCHNRYDIVLEAFTKLPDAVRSAMSRVGTAFVTQHVEQSMADRVGQHSLLPSNVTRLTRYNLELTHAPDADGWRCDLGHRTDVTCAHTIKLANAMLKSNAERDIRRTTHV